MVVVDASCAVKWFVPEDGWEAARTLLLGREILLAPDILALETLAALLRKLRRGEVVAETPARASETLAALRIEAIPHAALLPDAVALSRDTRHPLYDCLYLLVARQRRAMLATFDTRLAALATALAIPLRSPEAS
jgi:predicted nucleic acid-binding protein